MTNDDKELDETATDEIIKHNLHGIVSTFYELVLLLKHFIHVRLTVDMIKSDANCWFFNMQ